ncbi:DUF4179 domain-containing protein [Desulfosporosinus sp. BICA1-9]|uniref:DUF4179 domain-containing protein n=1 Tax=Desulfosporosinus sp. BICA1-9 TaxID=1531958 RepID=UPI00054B1541|nr:DUF4179 domain-containing protein [Desulfosporosinus sp. BICA1-9]KJS50915.1 MAG: hypothetical protein VR66_00025 [Peptococcaceae bacterium BRH_c23]KJS79478.1 MAG: hypothetical protein JL57_29635 [Desulfosporosinus sp. BICA1-9]
MTNDTIEEIEALNELDASDGLENSFKCEHDELVLAKPRATEMPIPTDLNDYIRKGLAQGIKSQKTWKFRKWSTLVACFILATFITAARVSPVVAAVLHQIPGLGYIVELINYDKGLQSAVENEFILPLEV